MLFKLSIQNIRKSIKDYAIYFFTLILGVAVFYVFNSIKTQSAMLELSSDTREMIQLLTTALSGVSVFIAFVLGFLVIYANRFLMKRRNKEFGLYLVLGMEKRKVSLILFFETLLMGFISLVVGLVTGVAASQLTSVLVAKMFEADMTKYQFVFSEDACIKTILYFAIMYVIVILFNTFSIGKCRLIDLFQGGKKSESVKVKNAWVCIIVFVIAASLLGTAYYHVTSGYDDIHKEEQILSYIAMGCIGTFLVFWSLSGLLLKAVSSMKSIYYKGLNSFTFRQLSSRVNTNVFSMTIICLMLFITICVLGSGLTLRNSMLAILDEVAPADIEICQRIHTDESDGYSKKKSEDKEKPILELYKELDVDLKSYFKEYVQFYMYATPDCTLKDTFGSRIEEAVKNYYVEYETKEDIIKLSDYNNLAKIYGKETYSLEKNEYMIIADYEPLVNIRNDVLKAGEKISLFGHDLRPKYRECKKGIVEMSDNHLNLGVIIVPDAVIDDSYKDREFVIAYYNTNAKDKVAEIEKKIKSVEKLKKDYVLPTIYTRTNIVEERTGLGAIISFIGLYIGFIFLISGASVLALKELSESADNLERFRMLRKLGVDEKQMNRALFRQIFFFFIFPLSLAVIHSIFGMKLSGKILGKMTGDLGMVSSILVTSIVLFVIYGGYFVITYFSSRSMMKE
ncbi:MAG: ABC transporter permease [Lachnospiraceae bacterium]|nr:ABC transporter permease [Lachnospiraceae bacterium]